MNASECKCCVCGNPAVTFWPIIDPDIPDYPYCRECLDKAKREVITEVFVTYEQALMLKDSGFDWETEYYYEFEEPADTEVVFKRTSSCDPFNHKTFADSFSAPTLSQAAKWLREVKGIKVYPLYEYFAEKWYYHCGLKVNRTKCSEASYATYESALSAGIDAALELIKEKA